MQPERSAGENVAISPRRKSGLETPLAGRFFRETRLLFAPPVWYDVLVVASTALGGLLVFGALGGLGIPLFGGGFRLLLLGTAVGLSGLWAAASNERMHCNLSSRTYARLQGQGVFKRWVKGSLDELDALVLISTEVATVGSRVVDYRLVLHWKNASQPILVVEQRRVTLGVGQPLNSRVGDLLARGQRYASAMKLGYYDNSYFHSPAPVPVL